MSIARQRAALVLLTLFGVVPVVRAQVAPATAAAEPMGADPAPAATAPAPDPTPTPPPERRPTRTLGPAFDAETLSHLPLGHGLWSVFETVEPTAILDRMETGGLYLGEA